MDLIVVMKAGVTDEDVKRVVERVAELGLVPHPSKGEFRTIVGAIGDRTVQAQQQLEQLPGVDEVMAIRQPYKLASREFHEADTILDIKGIRVGGPHVNIIAGPCAIESLEQLKTTAQAVKEAKALSFKSAPSSSLIFDLKSFAKKNATSLEILIPSISAFLKIMATRVSISGA